VNTGGGHGIRAYVRRITARLNTWLNTCVFRIRASKYGYGPTVYRLLRPARAVRRPTASHDAVNDRRAALSTSSPPPRRCRRPARTPSPSPTPRSSACSSPSAACRAAQMCCAIRDEPPENALGQLLHCTSGVVVYSLPVTVTVAQIGPVRTGRVCAAGLTEPPPDCACATGTGPALDARAQLQLRRLAARSSDAAEPVHAPTRHQCGCSLCGTQEAVLGTSRRFLAPRCAVTGSVEPHLSSHRSVSHSVRSNTCVCTAYSALTEYV
jgi:hypothetical protein